MIAKGKTKAPMEEAMATREIGDDLTDLCPCVERPMNVFFNTIASCNKKTVNFLL